MSGIEKIFSIFIYQKIYAILLYFTSLGRFPWVGLTFSCKDVYNTSDPWKWFGDVLFLFFQGETPRCEARPYR